MRIACLFVPDFPLAAVLRAEPELRGQALVVADAAGPRARLAAVSEAAARRGIAVGMTVAQARGVDGSLIVRCASNACRQAAQAALCDVADSFSPRVEDAGEGVVYLDVSGLSAIFPSEAALGAALVQRAQRLGFEASVGIAATRTAASLAAREGGGVTSVPPGEEWQILAPLSVDLLQPSPELRATLHRWGIRTVGELARLPASAVGARLGPEGLLLVHRARGEDERPIQPRPARMHFEEAVDLEYCIESLEPLAFVLRGLLDRLTARLAMRGFACGDLRLSLRLANRARDERTVAVAAPSNDARALLALVRLQLEKSPPAAPVEGVCLGAVPERLRTVQLDAFRPAGPAPERLAVALMRLAALCGADRVGAPALVDSHRLDAYRLVPFGSVLSRTLPWISAPRAPLAGDGFAVALRALRPPCPVEVFCDRGALDYVRGAGLSGRVVAVAGPWRIQAEWWSEGATSRDYYDVQLSDGGVYRMYCERKTQQWFVDGVYD